MKKFSLKLAAISSIIFATCSFASTIDLNSYSSTLHPLSKNVLTHPPTDITIINASTNFIYAVVPGSSVNDLLNPGFNDHIYGYNPNVWSTPIVLQDPYRATFYSNNVCRLAIVTVYGSPGAYRINIDSDLCN